MRTRLKSYAQGTYGLGESQEQPARQSSISSKVSSLREKVSSLRSNPSRIDESYALVEAAPQSEPEAEPIQASPAHKRSSIAYPGWPEDATVASIAQADTSDMSVDPATISDASTAISEASTEPDDSLPGSFQPPQIRRVVSRPLSHLTDNLTPTTAKTAAANVFGMMSTPNHNLPISPPAFVFGSPRPAQAFSFAHKESESMQEKIMSEVNRRVAVEGVKVGPSYERLYGSTEVSKDKKEEGRFADMHRKHFDQYALPCFAWVELMHKTEWNLSRLHTKPNASWKTKAIQ